MTLQELNKLRAQDVPVERIREIAELELEEYWLALRQQFRRVETEEEMEKVA